MHPCLAIPEILNIVFNNIYCTSEILQVYDEKSLLAIALSCSYFKWPALRIMWAEQRGLLPLLQCLPPDSWRLSSGNFSIIRELVREDWDPPRFYAAFIKSFGFTSIHGTSGTIGIQIDSNSWPLPARSAKSLNVILLPHLCSISIFDDVGFVLGFLEPLIGSELSSLIAYTSTLDGVQYIRTVASKSTNLRSFLLRMNFPVFERERIGVEPFVQIASDAIRHCHRLVNADVNIRDIDHDAFQHISHLKHLRNLCLCDTAHYGQKSLPFVPQSYGSFQEVRHLKLSVQRVQSAVEIFKNMCSTPLRSVDIGIMNNEAALAYDSLLTLFTKSASARSLTHLYIQPHNDMSNLISVASMSDAITGALELSNLEEFIFRLSSAFAVDDDILSRMAWSWRNLRVSDILTQSTILTTRLQHMKLCTATMGVLAIFAQCCPDLKKFSIPSLDTSDIPADLSTVVPGIEEMMVQNRVNVFIYVGYPSSLADPAAVSRFLSSIFWESRLQVTRLNDDGENEPWDDVQRSLARISEQRSRIPSSS